MAEYDNTYVYAFVANNPVTLLHLGLQKRYKWLLISFYTGQKPATGRNSWNKGNLRENYCAAGLGGYEYDPTEKKAMKTGPNKGRGYYAYPPLTKFTISRGNKGTDPRAVRDSGPGWAYLALAHPRVSPKMNVWTSGHRIPR